MSEGDVKHLTTIGVVVLFLMGVRLEAQEVASSFEQLAVLVKPGDSITVLDFTGRESKGRIALLSRDALLLDTSGGPRKLGETDVAAISQRRGDSLLNGAITGAVAGTAYFVTLMVILHESSDGGDVIVPTAIMGGMLMAGMGAAAGVGIDALITRRQVIYQAPAGPRKVSLVPVLGRGRRGVAVALRF